MLSEEEKKAIKYFYNLRSTIDESYMLFDEEINVKCGKETIKQISLVLNLITKLQKENELAKEQLKKQCEIADERNNLLVKVNRLESQINLMAKWIFDKDYRENSLLIHRDDYYSNCIKQVKKHFEKLAKEKGE